MKEEGTPTLIEYDISSLITYFNFPISLGPFFRFWVLLSILSKAFIFPTFNLFHSLFLTFRLIFSFLIKLKLILTITSCKILID